MIWSPREGQRVQIRHSVAKRRVMRWHGCAGVVRCSSLGPGPRNVWVALDNGNDVVVPRGNLFLRNT